MLPPSHGAFPLVHLEDFADAVPRDWIERGGVIMPRLSGRGHVDIAFGGGGWVGGYPFAVKIAAGMFNAISGKPWKPELDAEENDYIVVPEQPRLDGFCIAMNTIRQFVAMKLGAGYSVEEQLSGKGEHGGIQIIVYPMRKERYQRTLRSQREVWDMLSLRHFSEPQKGLPYFRRPRRIKMGLGAGGRMKQPIYKDPYGIDAWDQSVSSRCFVTLANAYQWEEMTGKRPPTEPPTAKDYAEIGLPWSDYYGADQALPGSPALAIVRGVAEMAVENGEQVLGPDGDVNPGTVVDLGRGSKPLSKPRPVREAKA